MTGRSQGGRQCRLCQVQYHQPGPHRPARAAHRARRPRGRVYLDKGLTGASRARPGLDQALAAVRDGDTFVTKLDRLARSVPDALAILTQLSGRGVRFALGGSI